MAENNNTFLDTSLKSLESIKKYSKDASDKGVEFAKQAGTRIVDSSRNAGEVVSNECNKVVDKVKSIENPFNNFSVEDIIIQSLKVPGVRVDRDSFLRKQFVGKYADNVINKAIQMNPAYAGIKREDINLISNEVIQYETNKVASLSFAAGLPGGAAMIATIPADTIQYFGGVLITMQKLAYLYGFKEFNLSDPEISDGTLNEIMIFLGVMFGIQQTNNLINLLASSTSKQMIKTLSNKALTKTTYYPIVKNVSKIFGIKMTKEIFAKSTMKIIPFAGGVLSGTLTYVTFKPGAIKLMNKLGSFELSDPDFYQNIIDAE